VLDPRVYESDTRPDWCPGCGDFGVLAALKNALITLQIPPERVFISSWYRLLIQPSGLY